MASDDELRAAVEKAWFNSPESRRNYATFEEMRTAMKKVALGAGVYATVEEELQAMIDTPSIHDVVSSPSHNVPIPDFVTDVPREFDLPDAPARMIHVAIQVDRETGQVAMWANTDDDEVVARLLKGNLEVLRRKPTNG